jgi:hypothetical protein
MPSLRSTAILAAASLAAVLACVPTAEFTTGVPSGLPGSDDTTGVAAAVAVVSGNNQTAPFSTALPDPLVVRVTNAAGDSLEDVFVDWTVTEGGGSLSVLSSSTDVSGLAQVSLTLGPGSTNRVRATVRNTTFTADFTATATAAGDATASSAAPSNPPPRRRRGP